MWPDLDCPHAYPLLPGGGGGGGGGRGEGGGGVATMLLLNELLPNTKV